MTWSEWPKNSSLKVLVRNSARGGRVLRYRSTGCPRFRSILGQSDANDMVSQLDRVCVQNRSCEASAAMLGYGQKSERTSAALRDNTACVGQKTRTGQRVKPLF